MSSNDTGISAPLDHARARRERLAGLRDKLFLSADDLSFAFSRSGRADTAIGRTFPVRRARRFLKRNACGFRNYPDAPWETTWERLREHAPALFEQLLIVTDQARGTRCRWCGEACPGCSSALRDAG